MGMTREERIALHKKQERLQVKQGMPSKSELKEGVPVLRATNEGVVEYVLYNGVLHKNIFDRVSGEDSSGGWHGSPTRIKILPRDFIPNDDQGYYNIAVEDEDSSYGIRVTTSTLEMYAYVPIPSGFKATKAMVYCSQNRGAAVLMAFIDGTSAVVKSSGMVCNTEHVLTNEVFSSETNFLIIKADTTSDTDVVYGGYVTIEYL